MTTKITPPYNGKNLCFKIFRLIAKGRQKRTLSVATQRKISALIATHKRRKGPIQDSSAMQIFHIIAADRKTKGGKRIFLSPSAQEKIDLILEGDLLLHQQSPH
ncbi:MAG: hypothetical protein PHS07_03515 [Patescibacteria group bacterium]|nr:hypothetical protein [Patescibacteria group bacterium]